jgi:hypothetical protein
MARIVQLAEVQKTALRWSATCFGNHWPVSSLIPDDADEGSGSCRQELDRV